MKTIYKGRDDLYYVVSVSTEEGKPLSPSELDAVEIEFFTNNSSSVTKTLEDITPEGVLHINASELETLADGPLRARFTIKLANDAFDDSTYDQTADRLTGYFLKSLPAGQAPLNVSTNN